MITEIRKNTGIFLARLQGFRRRRKQMDFAGVYSHARSALFIIPDDDGHQSQVIDVLRKAQLQFQGNALTIVMTGSSGKLSGKLKQCLMVPVRDDQLNFFFLPKRNLITRLQEQRFDVIVDLNFSVTPLAASICAVLDAPLKAGFTSPRSDVLYNFQLHSAVEREPKARYEQLLRTLAMF